jgi:hypothetical protein
MKIRSKKVKSDVLTALRNAGIRPELVHAYERTGLLLLEAGYNKLSPADRAEYDAAIDEYFAKTTRN